MFTNHVVYYSVARVALTDVETGVRVSTSITMFKYTVLCIECINAVKTVVVSRYV